MGDFSALSQVVKEAGSDGFGEALVDYGQSVAGIDHCSTIWIGPGTEPPALLFTYGLVLEEKRAEQVAQAYAARSRQDPNYRKLLGASPRTDGVLLPFPVKKIDDPSYIEYFYDAAGVVDKVSTVTTVDEYKILSNYYRLAPSPPFSDKDRGILKEVLPLFAALIGNHFQLSGMAQRETSVPGGDNTGARVGPVGVEVLLGDAESPFAELSERERQVCEGIALGQRTDDLAVALDVSASTVVTYRRRAYAKLGVGSANELLRLIMNSQSQSSE